MSKAKKQPTADALRYEQAVEQLEEIVDRVESGEIGLEDSLAEYERGMRLIAHCRSILDRSQKRIAELMPGDNDTLAVADAPAVTDTDDAPGDDTEDDADVPF